MKRRRAKGEGSLYQRERTLPSGRVVRDWVCVVSLGYAPDGKRIRRKFCGPSLAAVRDKMARVRALHGGSLRPSAGTTVAEYLGSWLESVKLARSPLTHRSYAQVVDAYAVPNIGRVRLDDLDGPRIESLYATLSIRGVSADQVGKLRKALRRALNVAVAKGLIPRNPVAHVDAPRHRVKERESYDAAQLATFFEATRGDRLEAMFRLGVLAVMRPGELFALRWCDVNLEAGYVDIRNSIENDGGALAIVPAKADSARRSPLEPETVALLRAHQEAMRAEKHGSAFVFVTRRGKWLRDPVNRTVLAPICKLAGLPTITLYGLRHSGVSLFGEAGVSLRVAADMAGHSTTDLTANVYTHAGEPQHRDGIEKAAALIRKRGEPRGGL